LSFNDPTYGFILGYFNGTKSTQTHVVVLTAGDPVQFKNVDASVPHTVAFLGDASSSGAPWPPSFNGGTKISPVGTFIGKTGFTTGSLLPGKKSKIYNAGMPGFYMIGCQFHYDSNMMRDVVIVQ
jgi:plastocyanin